MCILYNVYTNIVCLSDCVFQSCSVFLFPMQLGGFKVPFITVAGAIFFLVPIILVLMKPTSELYCHH